MMKKEEQVQSSDCPEPLGEVHGEAGCAPEAH